MVRLAKRVQALTPSTTMAITAKAKSLKDQGIHVIGFGAGEPDFNTPDHIIGAAYDALKKGHTKYTAAGGIVPLKQAIRKKLESDNQLTYTNDQVIVCNGAKHALYNIFQVLCNPGDEVIIPTPYWVSYPEQAKLAEAVPVYVTGKEENAFKVTPEQLEKAITPKSKIFIMNSPSNPTGAVYSEDELKAIGEVCIKHDLWIISDEIYEKLIYDGVAHVSIASLSKTLYDRTIVVNGVSKPYAMTGWRIGYAAGNADVIGAMTDLASHSTSNAATMAQYAALEAIEGEQDSIFEMKNAFHKRRDRMVMLLNAIPGVNVMTPPGAFYVFVNVGNIIKDSGYASVDAWAEDLLNKAYVAVIPGSSFGAPDYIRLSYALGMKDIEEGIKRIGDFITNS